MGVKFDLVYMDSNKRDQGILQDFSFISHTEKMKTTDGA